MMEVKDAIRKAKTYVMDVFGDEQLSNLGLEEIERDDAVNEWRITIGFSRPWSMVRDTRSLLTGEPSLRRTYRVVTIRDDQVTALRRRDELVD